MSSKITFTYKDKPYALEFTRNSIKQMESKGFVAEDVISKPMLLLPELFAGSFIANHRFVSRKIIDEIYSQFDDKGELLGELCAMFAEVVEEFVNDLERKNNGLSWERTQN
ncbi:MAG: DUF5055 domain-containing protein [Oscillospiraceae bacterium]